MHHFASHSFQSESDVCGTHISEVCFISGRNGPCNQLDNHVVQEFSEGAGEGMHTKETEVKLKRRRSDTWKLLRRQ